MKDGGCEKMGVIAEGGDWRVCGKQGKSLQKVFEDVIVCRWWVAAGIAQDIEA